MEKKTLGYLLATEPLSREKDSGMPEVEKQTMKIVTGTGEGEGVAHGRVQPRQVD
jgi:hypothetical protein